MSIVNMEEVECPECRSKRKVRLWRSINAQLDPEAKRDLLEDNINRFHCDNCGTKARVLAPLAYHDMENRYYVEFVPFDRIENDKFLASFTDSGELDLSNTGVPEDEILDYFQSGKVHIVFSMHELVRYVMFRDRLAQRKAV